MLADFRCGSQCTAPASTSASAVMRGGCRSVRSPAGRLAASKRSSGGALKYAPLQRITKEPLVVSLSPDGSDTWRIEPVIRLLEQGGVGIIPTDSLPAVVCDLENRNAVKKLYTVMELHPKKQLSILCRGFADISVYTTGFPPALHPGQPDTFGIVRRILPGPYTFILPASKRLPSQVVDPWKGTTKHRSTVGVRWPKEPICQAVLEELGRVLLSHSVHVPGKLGEITEVPDLGTLLDTYGNTALDFIVDVGPRVATASSVVDMTGAEPVVVRKGLGDVSMFEAY